MQFKMMLLTLLLPVFFVLSACETKQHTEHSTQKKHSTMSDDHTTHGESKSVSSQKISIENPWIRAVPPTSNNSALYLILHNHTDKDETLISAQSPIAVAVELHNVIEQDGVFSMIAVPEILIPAKSSIALQPANYHIMLIGLKEPLQEGSEVPVTFTFTHSSPLQRDVPVQKGAGANDHHHMNH